MISIVIPVLNEEKLLPDCLASLRKQDYKGEYEIIVADNGSIDNAARIAQDFGAKVISCPEKRSVFYARQVGADAACGDIIVQADADTIYPEDWLKRIADQFASYPEVVAITGRYLYRDKWFWAKLEYFLRHRINKLTAALSGRPLLISGATFAFRRKPFLLVNGYIGLSFSADQYGISSRLHKFGRVLYEKDLYCLTSSRTVQKPTFLIAIDFLVNFSRYSWYFCKSYINEMRGVTVKKPSRRIARLLPIPISLLIIAVYGYVVPQSPVFGKVYYGVSSTEKIVALTFDDGPNDPYTSQILDILDSYDIKATFFAIGKNVELYPETARRIVNEGHALGNHSYSHNANHALTNYGSRDMFLAQEVLFDIVGVKPHLYRPPHGKTTPWELQEVSNGGLVTVTWTTSANELGSASPESFAQKIVNKTAPGKIILMHDGYGTEHDNRNSDKTLTVKALPLIIEKLQDAGYEFVTVPDLFNMPAYNN